jgi:5-methylthioadenosine/S-adenosylhomocysteine deaminase
MLLLHDADWVITAPDSVMPRASLCIDGSRIVAVGPSTELRGRFPDAPQRDCSGMAVAPGFVNSHNHVYELLYRGLGKNMTTEQWLRNLVYPANSVLDDDDFYAGAQLACAEAYRSGTTAMVEQLTNLARFHADAEFRAFEDAGIRARVARAASTASTIDARENGEPDAEVGAARAFLSRWHGHDLVQPWLGPSGLFSCDPVTLQRLKALATHSGARFAIHLSETREQLELARAHGYTGQVDWAYRLGLLDEDTVVSHAIWITDAEIRLLAETGCHVVHNPSSNVLMTSGIANIIAMRRAGVNLCLGTDGPASNDSQDMLAEVKMAGLLARASTLDPTIISAAECWRMATEAGADTLGHPGELGRLEPGSLADITVFGVSGNSCLNPVYEPVETLVYAGSGRDVCMTIVNGRVVYDHGTYMTIDLEGALDHIDSVVIPKVRKALQISTATTKR